MRIKIYIAVVFTLLSFVHSQAQNLGNYIHSYANQEVYVKHEVASEEALKNVLSTRFPQDLYPNMDFALLYTRESLGGQHFTYQVAYNRVPIEQCLLKIHFNKDQIQSIQHNIPSATTWANLDVITGEIEENSVYLIVDEQIILAEKELKIDESKDYYANQFKISESSFYENILRYHNDTSAHVSVFYPDPLSSANQSYGGNYQDSYAKDTIALVIQSVSNTGGTTITVNGSSYTFNGQSFNVSTESYAHNFTDPTLFQVFESITLDGQGTVLGYNTAITDDTISYTSSIKREDYNYPELANEQIWKTIPLDFSGGVFNLTNDYFIISEFSAPFTNPTTSLNDTFNFNRSNIQFEDVNAFYHLNNYKSYWESIGFTNLASEVLLVDAHGNNGADNSFFSPTSPPRLVFGQGGVDDAEDADVIIHEYGHALSHFAAPNTNVDSERRALDEGFGDYLATSYSLSITPNNGFNVFSWDGHNEFWSGRISNSNKTAHDIDLNENIYYNGEIWSTTLMDLHALLGRTITDQLAIEVMYYNMPNTTISQAALNLFKADTAIYNGIHSCNIFDVLQSRNFLKGNCTDFYLGIREDYNDDNEVQLVNTYGFSNRNENLLITSKDISLLGSIVEIYNAEGKLIKSEKISGNQHEISGQSLAPGIYFINLRTNQKPYRFKVSKTQ